MPWRLALLLLLSGPAAAQPVPACMSARVGTVACLAGRLCECRYDPGGSMTGMPGGYRWNCSLLRPPCGEALAPPGVAPPPPLPVMPQILLEPGMDRPGPGWPGR